MPYLYHATNKANLVGIRDVGMAPASRRPASRALGATQQNRIDKRESKRLASFKKFLKSWRSRAMPTTRSSKAQCG